jgi:AcrR family transcriptional regulator
MADSKTLESAPEGNAKRQRRSLVTHRDLLRSAREIFARDGFEHARIEDIAALAGKTRGAFYANFKDKEDVFFAIFEDDLDRDMARLSQLLLEVATIDQRIDVLSTYLWELGNDSQRTLLHIEFKLYAIRHPSRRQRLVDLHAIMRERCAIPEINNLLPGYDQQDASEELTRSLAIGAVMDGLSLNRLFDPETINVDQYTRYLKLCIREALDILNRAGIESAILRPEPA